MFIGGEYMGMGSLPLLPLETPGAKRGRNTLTLGAHECVVVDVGCCCSVSVSVVVCVCVIEAIASVQTQVKRDSSVILALWLGFGFCGAFNYYYACNKEPGTPEP